MLETKIRIREKCDTIEGTGGENMDFMEIFTLVTGVIYIILEIRQKNLMWAIGVLTSVAAMVVFFRQGLYASFGLNTYYLVMSFIQMSFPITQT